MRSVSKSTSVGKGSPDSNLNAAELREIVKNALAEIPANAKVLVIIPDKTRDNNTHILFPIAAEILRERKIAKLDAIVAQGTHGPMTDAEKYAKIGARNGKLPEGLGRIYDHQWHEPRELVTKGTLRLVSQQFFGRANHQRCKTQGTTNSSDPVLHSCVGNMQYALQVCEALDGFGPVE